MLSMRHGQESLSIRQGIDNWFSYNISVYLLLAGRLKEKSPCQIPQHGVLFGSLRFQTIDHDRQNEVKPSTPPPAAETRSAPVF